ncbi:MAG: hypothetical protein HY216_14325 [Candidatus Rokubacteria bacterium]|nr:hypothetical protein [Candidatus Rokubacteria bacterium]
MLSLDNRDAYTYLLGMYLGDGCLAGLPQHCRLTISLDSRYPGIVSRCGDAMRTLYPGRKAHTFKVKDANCVIVTSHGWRWLALFPHHGRGRKHERKIELQDWQRKIVIARPFHFLRGLIESDGCRSIRRQDGKDYPFYSFDNRSTDILDLFCWACDLVGVHYTRPKQTTISVARRADVAILDARIGPKA